MRLCYTLFLLIVVIISFSCRGRGDVAVPLTWRVGNEHYIEQITVAGTVQAVDNRPVVPPGGRYGQMRVESLAADGSFVRQGDTIAVLTIPDIEQIYDAMLSGVESVEASIRRAEVNNRIDMRIIESQLAASEVQMNITFLDSLKLLYASEHQRRIIELELRKMMLEREKLERSLEARRMMGETEIRQLQSRLIQQQNNLRMIEQELESLIIVAGRDGMVTRAEAPSIVVVSPSGTSEMGGEIREGSTLFFGTPILNFPDLSRLQISARVNEDDYRRIESGQEVVITLSATGGTTLSGRVNRKSLAGGSMPGRPQTQVRLFEVIIDIIDEYGDDAELMPGLSVNCHIVLRREEALFVPAISLFERDDARVVYVKSGDRFVPAEVETGYSGSSFIVVNRGLEGGEDIALSRPPERLVVNGVRRMDVAEIDSRD